MYYFMIPVIFHKPILHKITILDHKYKINAPFKLLLQWDHASMNIFVFKNLKKRTLYLHCILNK